MVGSNYCNLHSAFAIEKLPLMVAMNLQWWQLPKQLAGPHQVCALSLSFGANQSGLTGEQVATGPWRQQPASHTEKYKNNDKNEKKREKIQTKFLQAPLLVSRNESSAKRDALLI